MSGRLLTTRKNKAAKDESASLAEGRRRFRAVESLESKDIDVAIWDPARRETDLRCGVDRFQLVGAEIWRTGRGWS